jgi:deoxyribonuclease-1
VNRIAAPVLAFVMLSLASADQERIADYEEARLLFWNELYAKGGKTLYCGEPFSARSKHRKGVNIEHVFPMGWVKNELNCGTRKQCRVESARFNRIEADLHNLYPSRVDVNDARSAYRFGDVPGEKRAFGDCDFEADERKRVAEPRPASRGEIARAMFYMKEEYGLTIFKKSGELLVKWHFQDQPSKHEKWRNDRIEQIQGTRNMFVDQPELARLIEF